MREHITKDDLREFKDDLERSFDKMLDLKFAALPCGIHGQRVTEIANKVEDAKATAIAATTTALRAQDKADAVKEIADKAMDVASGDLWKLARYGIAGLLAAAGVKLPTLLGWCRSLADIVKPHHG